MDLPANILLSKITPKHLYLDKKSKEFSTNVTKRKYKLAGNQILDQYFFNILTRNSSACKTQFTLCIEPKDWQNKVSGSYLGNQNSYCDLTKFELLSKSDLISKMRDRDKQMVSIRPEQPAWIVRSNLSSADSKLSFKYPINTYIGRWFAGLPVVQVVCIHIGFSSLPRLLFKDIL